MEIIRYLNGVTVGEKELKTVKIITPEIAEAVNEVRRRASEKGMLDKIMPQKVNG